MKVLFMTNIPSPYRVDFFNELGKYCDLLVTFEGLYSTERNVKWKAEWISTFNYIFLKGIRTKPDQFLCFEIIEILKRKYDFIIVGGYSTPTSMLAIEFMRLHNIPFIIEADGGIVSNDSWLKDKIKRHFISAASYWLSSGKETSDYFVHYGAEYAKIYCYPFTSIRQGEIRKRPLSKCEKSEIRTRLGMNQGKIAVSVGRLIYGKGYDILLKAWSNCCENGHLYIIGGKPTDELIFLKKQLNLKNLHFVDFMTKKELKNYYYAADLFVLPTRQDVWGLVVNEAMACGLPIITTNKCVAGLELVKNGENGYIVPVENDKLLAEKIQEIFGDEKLRERMAVKSIEKIQSYTIEEMARSHYDSLEKILKL